MNTAMDKEYCNSDVLERDGIRDVYVPFWAKTMIELYTSSLKYEVMDEMQMDDKLL